MKIENVNIVSFRLRQKGADMAFSWMKKAPQGPQIDKAPPEGIEAFKKFYEADSLVDILDTFKQVCDCAKIEQGGRYVEFFPYLKAAYLVSFEIVTIVTFPLFIGTASLIFSYISWQRLCFLN